MGQKVRGIRLGITSDWSAKWYSSQSKEYAKTLNADLAARAYLEQNLKAAGVSHVLIERDANALSSPKITVSVARPGVVIGKKGNLAERIKNKLQTIMGAPVYLSIKEVFKPELDAKLIAENIASQMVRRIDYKRATKKAALAAMKAKASGVSIIVSGRLRGSEIARDYKHREGSVPLSKLRAYIDDGYAEAQTTSGKIGVKVYIHLQAEQLKRDAHKKSESHKKAISRKNYGEVRSTARNRVTNASTMSSQ